uniref:Uncharacterized protein n=1 Tax=Anguilla anguilla TaxID=7936 RepID=A0A0E9TYV0_ANGAN
MTSSGIPEFSRVRARIRIKTLFRFLLGTGC